MSRIHEALKKAEQERAAVQTTNAVALPIDLTTAASARGQGAPNMTADIHAGATVGGLSQGQYFRFDELCAHCANPPWHLDPNVNVFVGSNGHGAEQFRSLRSRLYQLRGNGSNLLRTLLITSAMPAEGKTFVVNNLAQGIVRQPDRRVLMIDADLRLPRLHVALGAPTTPGLTDYLRGQADAMEVIQHGQVGNLCFIPGGKEVTNPSELLSNGRLKTLLDRLTPVFDWVILDSPPCLPVADSSILADFCDGVLMVVGAGSTPCETVQKACREFRERNLIGVVLNRAEENPNYGAYHYYADYGESEQNAR